MPDKKPLDTNDSEEFENFDKLARKLFNLTPQEIERVKAKEKAEGIEPDESDEDSKTQEPVPN